MQKVNSVFLTGTLGLLFTAIVHILLEGLSPGTGEYAALSLLYPIFSIFLIAGTVIMAGRRNPVK
jgi:hypothetical protein